MAFFVVVQHADDIGLRSGAVQPAQVLCVLLCIVHVSLCAGLHALLLLLLPDAAAAGSVPPLSADEDVYMQLVQMQKLSNTLVQDMKE
jgi:hypothetical protein